MSSNNMSYKIGLDVSAYNQGIKSATDSTKTYTNQVETLTKDLPNLKREFGQVNKQAAALTLAISKMTAEQKRSAEGRAMIKALEEATSKAAEYKDMIMDLGAEIKNRASDTRGLDILKDAVTVTGNAFSSLAGTIGLVTGEEDKMKKALVAFTTVQSTVNTLTAIQNTLQQQSSLMLGISTLQRKAQTAAVELETAAEGKNIVVTKAATAAQATLNAVASANPYMLIVVAIGALVGAYIAYEDEINKLIGIENEEEQSIKELTDAFKNQTSQLADTQVKVNKLQLQWKELKSEAEKKKWIEDNQDAFKELGVKIDDVNDAENFLIKNTAAFVEAQSLRAKSLAYAAVAATKYQKAIELREEADEKDLAWYEIAYKQLGQWAKGGYVQSAKQLTHAARADMYDEAEALEEQALENIKEGEKLEQRAAEILKEAGIKEADKKTDNTKPTKTPKSNSSKNEEKTTLEKLKEQRDKLDKAREKLLDEAGNVTDQKTFDEFTKQIENIDKILEKAELVLHPKIEVDKVNTEELQKSIQDIFGKLDEEGDVNIKGQFSGLSDEAKEEADKALEEYNRIYEAREALLKLLNNPELNTEQYDMVAAAINSIADSYELATDNVKKYNEAAAVQLDVANQKKEQDEKAAQILAVRQELTQSLVDATQLLGDTEAAQVVQFTANTAQTVADLITRITALQAEALAGATASGSKMPFPFNLAAIAAGVAAVTKIFSSLPKFAEGGIITGPYTTGDRLLARVNAGERILTTGQQKNLDKALDNDRLYSGSNAVKVQGVTVVRGSDLDIVWTNYERTKKRAH